MTTREPRLVAGVSVDVLKRAFLNFEIGEPDEDGMIGGEVRLPPDLGAPFTAALMRIEAELMLEDADRLAAGNVSEQRTYEQRACDALVELNRRVFDPPGSSAPATSKVVRYGKFRSLRAITQLYGTIKTS